MWATGQYGYPSDYLIWCLVPVSLAVHVYCFFRIIKGRPRRWWHLVVGNALVTLLMLSCVALVAETYLRFVSTTTDTFDVTLTSKHWFAVYPERNSLHCRDVEWREAKPAGTRRIAFLGDSFTFGWGINDRADRFTDRLQRDFDERGGGKVEVMNAGTVAPDTTIQIELAKRLVEGYHLDEIVLCYVPTDLERSIPETDGTNPLKAIEPRAIDVDSSFLLNYLYYRVVAPRLIKTGYFAWLQRGYDDPAVWHRQVERFDELISLCKSAGVKLRVVLLPFVVSPGADFDTAGVNAKVAAAFRSRGVEVADLADVFKGLDPWSLTVSAHDMHPNAKAHRLLGEAIWNAFFLPK